MDKILLIENCHLFRLQIKNALERNGFSNIVEFSSAELIAKAPQLYLNEVVMIIMDIDLPVINGIELAGLLKKNPQYCTIPIIFISGNNDYKIVQAAIEAGGIDYIAKPFKFDTFVKRIEKVMINAYGEVKGKSLDNHGKLLELIADEYDRAVRAGKSLSFIIYKFQNNSPENITFMIKGSLRKIDNVVCVDDKIVIILPITRENNLTTVINKIQGKLQDNGIDLVLDKTVTFRPSTKKSFNELIKEIFKNW